MLELNIARGPVDLGLPVYGTPKSFNGTVAARVVLIGTSVSQDGADHHCGVAP